MSESGPVPSWEGDRQSLLREMEREGQRGRWRGEEGEAER